MIRKTVSVLLLAAGLAVSVATPRIEVDNTTFNCGKVVEGKDSSVKAKFVLKNTGTSPLKISNVRVSCGCTVLKYDTIIDPGKTSIIEPVVNIEGFRAGFMSKSITIISNAQNNQALNLIIEADIAPAIEISETYLTFENVKSKTLYLASAKKDLKVSGIVFKPQAQGNQGWAASVPLNLKYKFTALDSTRADGFRVYRLDINSPGADKEPLLGEFHLTTNHPDKQEAQLRGRINNQ
ncbi:MAG: DUF1573 domain-containing protein [Chitinispirillales bacterium]|jgi:hypothetical protein|nr:DUF1573 domain-containing protein [Chitinispirillales bacterium]